MSEFKAEVVRVEVEDHPNADRLDIAIVGGYNCIVQKGLFADKDLAVYIPEGSIVPKDVLETLGLVGRLSGSNKNRVKAIKLRGVLSQGLVHPPGIGRLQDVIVTEGDVVTEVLGLEKYVPKIPGQMAGKIDHDSQGTLKYDVEALKRYPDWLPPGTDVVVTEKIHGTFCGISYKPPMIGEDGFRVFSKGLGAKGQVILDVPENNGNIYVRNLRKYKEASRSIMLAIAP